MVQSDCSSTKENRMKECPYCEKYFKPKGLNTHIRRTKDEAHGDVNEVPEDFKERTVKIISKPEDNTTGSQLSENHLYLCHHCNNLFKGERGYKIHIGNSDNSPVHPDDLSFQDGDYSLVPADENNDPLMELDEVYKITKHRRQRGDILDR